MTEAQAWREIARRVDRLESHDGYLCDQVGYLSGQFYPCWAPFDYPDVPRVDAGLAWRMKDRIRAHMHDAANTAFPESEHFDKHAPELAEFRAARVLAALFLALEAEDEAAGSSMSSSGR